MRAEGCGPDPRLLSGHAGAQGGRSQNLSSGVSAHCAHLCVRDLAGVTAGCCGLPGHARGRPDGVNHLSGRNTHGALAVGPVGRHVSALRDPLACGARPELSQCCQSGYRACQHRSALMSLREANSACFYIGPSNRNVSYVKNFLSFSLSGRKESPALGPTFSSDHV